MKLAALLTSLLFCTVITSGTQHVCRNSNTEKAGLSGMIRVESGCHLQLTDIAGQINIQGVSTSQCEGSQQLTINDKTYCVDATVAKAVINVTDDKLEVKAQQVQSFTIE